MNIKEYISSGVVESYVLGLASQAEREEFENMCRLHPEIVEARNAFEIALEEQLLKDAPAPPAFMKERIEQALTANATASETESEQEETPVRRLNVWKWVAAASLILLAGSLFWAVSVNQRYRDLQEAHTGLKSQADQDSRQLAQLKQDAEVMQNARMVALKGTAIAPGASTTVYWDTTGTTKDVYLLINNLPQPPSEKQYQLWALLDGKPIDLGVVDYEVREKRLLIKARNVQQAQAFAITLEPKGGSQNPTLEQMYVVGQL